MPSLRKPVFRCICTGVAAAMAIEDLFPGQSDLDREPELERQLRDDDFMIEGITLAAEAAAVRAGNDANARSGNVQGLGERTMYVVRALCGRVHGDAIVILGNGN